MTLTQPVTNPSSNVTMMTNHPTQYRRRRGATAVLFAVLLIIFVGMSAFIIDLGRMQLVRSQMQTAVDSGALAASLHLKKNTTDLAGAKLVAEDFVRRNQVGFVGTVPRESITVESGDWDPDKNVFKATTKSPLAMRVQATQSNEPFFFAGVFGLNTFSIPRQSVAAIEGAPLDIMLVLDLSGSMSSEGRIEALRNGAPVFVNVVEGLSRDDRIGVMGYGVEKGKYTAKGAAHQGKVYTATPASLFPNPSIAANDWAGVLEADLTANFTSLRSYAVASSSLMAGKYGGGTPIGAAIRDAAHYLNANPRPEVDKLIVLMSDGEANKPSSNPSSYAVAMANYAASLDIRIDTISLGNSADVNLMGSIASVTEGRHFNVTGSGASLATKLADAFREIANGLKRTTLVK